MAEKILIIDDDIDTLRLVGLMLQRQGYQILAAQNGHQGLIKVHKEHPDLILLDVMMPDMDGYEVTRRIRTDPAISNTPILMFTAKTQLDDKVAGFEVGADDYLTKPTHPTELQAHVKALLARTTKSTKKLTTRSIERNAFVIGVLSPRSGLGVSTIAVNLAASLFAQTRMEAIIAEFTPGYGTLGLDLGVDDLDGLTNLLSLNPSEITREKVRDALVSHGSGLRFLFSSYQPRDVQLIAQSSQFEIIENRLAKLTRYLVLDLGAGLPEFSQKILPLCDERIVVMEGNPFSLAHTRVLLKEITDLGIDPMKITLVLNNRVRTEVQMNWSQVQQQVGHSISMTLTPAPELFYQASRVQMPAVMHQTEGLTTQQFGKLSETILERQVQRRS